MLAGVNLHKPPARRQAVVGDSSAFLCTVGGSVKVVAGDLNRPLGPRRGGWLSEALGSKGWLSGLRPPHRPGELNDVMWRVRRPSQRGLDWVLIGSDIPCLGAHKSLLPGPRTHRMV